MSAFQIEIPPTSEALSLATVKNFLRVITDNDDVLIGAMIVAAREYAEVKTSRSICPKGYVQTLDAFPYYADSAVSQLACPPDYYSRPRYSTNALNYSQMVKLFAPPLIGITALKYIDTNGDTQVLSSDKFIVDPVSEPARIFPGPPGSNWPATLFVPNAVSIHFLAGYSGASLTPPMPSGILIAMMMIISNWYEHRDASEPGNFGTVPHQADALLWANRVLDYSPTRG